ncbi:aggregation-promoting factor C-terminal-like domain-containing protein, partial [Clavibacter michiganensis]|uniref:aggregation-promoting factor C-terminal-like domain-containing protein n=1 Tax=Clavibacter michiganensis TaxID=28447 RepID=UPI00292DCC18
AHAWPAGGARHPDAARHAVRRALAAGRGRGGGAPPRARPAGPGRPPRPRRRRRSRPRRTRRVRAAPSTGSGSGAKSSGSGGGGAIAIPDPGSAKGIARSILASQGMGDDQYACLDYLWTKESGWRVNAYNPSGAYGIPQALPGSKMASAGPDWQTNPATQITWGLGYIDSRYGSPCGAKAHSVLKNWY